MRGTTFHRDSINHAPPVFLKKVLSFNCPCKYLFYKSGSFVCSSLPTEYLSLTKIKSPWWLRPYLTSRSTYQAERFVVRPESRDVGYGYFSMLARLSILCTIHPRSVPRYLKNNLDTDLPAADLGLATVSRNLNYLSWSRV